MKQYVKDLAADRLKDCERILSGKINQATTIETVICREKIKKALEECEKGLISDYMAVEEIITA